MVTDFPTTTFVSILTPSDLMFSISLATTFSFGVGEDAYFSFVLNTLYVLGKAEQRCRDGDVLSELLKTKAVFELKTAASIGYLPELRHCVRCGRQDTEVFSCTDGGNSGNYMRAMEQKAMAETVTKVLYPEDNHYEGKRLRLAQQYFLVSASVQDIVRRLKCAWIWQSGWTL